MGISNPFNMFIGKYTWIDYTFQKKYFTLLIISDCESFLAIYFFI